VPSSVVPPAIEPSPIEVDGLTIRYGDRTAVDHLTFSVEAGTVLALLGPNGAGKTSTVEALEGYRPASGGRVRVLGLDPVVDHRRLTPRIGVMLQDGGVYTAARPPEVLRLFASYYDHPADPDELLDRVGLADHRRSTWKTMSGGEQQRLSLALALVGRPEVVFLDEPTSGIDPSGRQLIRRVIADLRGSGVTVLLTTHDLDEAERLADRVVIIDHGRVLAAGTPDELTASGAGEEIRFAAVAEIDVVGLGAVLGADVAEVAPGEYRVDAAPTPATVAALTGWLAERDLSLGDLGAGRQRLEDFFLRLTESAATSPDELGAVGDGDPSTSRGGRDGRRRGRRGPPRRRGAGGRSGASS
jgi:ABC-2 type transport system ATP-binding protein